MIPDDKIAEVRERTDVVALVGEYVRLKRAGASFKGLCPFHAEKTPSFHVHPARQYFHCFGCQASGDAIGFLMKLEGRSFPEALRTLAERAGIELPSEDAQADAEQRRLAARRERLLNLVDAAAGFYMKQLREHPLASLAQTELERRSISAETAEQFRLGYAPHGWDSLARFLADHGWSLAEAEAAGLVVPRKSGDGFYDRFRHRLLFPIADVHGRVVAFSGRALAPPPGEAEHGELAKYVNSPETVLYKKAEVLFGLHEGRVEIRREGWALLCEGNFDLIAMHQAGLKNAVAPLGTAFTLAQAKLLRRFAERVTIVFDGDSAGRKAVRAAFPLVREAGLSAKVVSLPDGQDPDAFLRGKGIAALRSLIDTAPGMIEYLIDQTAAETAGEAGAKAKAIGELGPIVGAIDNPVERRLYIDRIVRRFEVSDVSAVREQLRRGVRPGATRNDTALHASRSVERQDLPELERNVVGAMIDVPRLLETDEAKSLEELLTSPDLRAILRNAAQMFRTRRAIHAPALLAQVEEGPARRWLEQRLSIELYEDERAATDALRGGIEALDKQRIERERAVLTRQIMAAHREGDEERALTLTKERDRLAHDVRKAKTGSAASS